MLQKINKKKVLGKILQFIIVIVLLSILVFVLARLCPGDPLRAYYGDSLDRMSETQKELARHNMGLDQSIAGQYIDWAKSALSGDFGISYQYKRPVVEIIGNFLGNTLLLGGLSFVFTFWFAILLGRYLALHEGEKRDRIICKLGIVSNNIPTFFLALCLIMIFAVYLHIFPTGGAYSIGNRDNLLDRAYHLVLPVTVMVLGHLWYYAYMIRNSLIEEARKEYVLLAKAQGIPRKIILNRFCFKNTLPSLFAIMAVALPHIIGGTYVVEMVFGYPGLGTLSFESALYKDYNMLMALSLLTGAIIVLFSMIAQALSEYVDLRTRQTEVTGHTVLATTARGEGHHEEQIS